MIMMTKIACRRLIALAVAYAVAVQAVLAAFAMPATAAVPEICASAGPGPIPGSIPMRSDCAACPVLCGSARLDGIVPDIFVFAPPSVPSFGIDRRFVPAVPPSAQRRLPPTRGPPVA
jgi:hypothetical protein